MLEIICCVLIAISVFLILDNSVIKKFLGLVLFGSTINLIIFLCGRIQGTTVPFTNFITNNQATANPLAQALILTAIVIGFALLALLANLLKILAKKNYSKV